jgi:hypothetical protein
VSKRNVLRVVVFLSLGLTMIVVARKGSAQQLIMKGEFGMKAGAQAPPGFYAGMFGAINWNDELKGPDGRSVPSEGGSLNQYLFGPLLIWVTDLKVLGANYGMMAAIPFANTTVDFPRFFTQSSSGFDISQLWIVPVQLGWHLDRADLIFQYAFYPPTGRYSPGASNNTGLGMWCNELALLSTVYFDKGKNWHLSASAFYDINSKKKDIDWTQGNPFTLMWGLGANYGSGDSLFKGWGGVAGYAQWQVTSTSGADVPRVVQDNKAQIYGIGPELTTLQGALTIRYFWNFGGVYTLQGHGLYVQFVMPIKL